MTEIVRGLLDTSVVIDYGQIDPALLPAESCIAAITLAELTRGPHATDDRLERARRQARLQWAMETWEPLPFDAAAAGMYGVIYAAARAAGQTSHVRLADYLIAATAAAHGLPLFTRNAKDFAALEGVVRVTAV